MTGENEVNENLNLGLVIDRAEVAKICDDYSQIMETEKHHSHEIIETESGVLRWKKDPLTDLLVGCGDLNDIIMTLYGKGHDKNSEIYRELYRKMGYSLSGYWEVFYWEANNECAKDYKPCR
jgi:hypothetical protein